MKAKATQKRAPTSRGGRHHGTKILDARHQKAPSSSTRPKRKRKTTKPRFEYIDFDKYHREGIPKKRWILENWVSKNDIVLVAGGAGIGKSTLVADLAVACATGRPWCGIPIERPIKVLCFDEEMGLEDTVRLYMRLEAPTPNLRVASCKGIRLDTAAGRSRLRSEIRTHRPELVVLDSVQQVFGQTDENISTQVGEIYRFLFGLRDVYELTLLLVHHKRKGGNRWSEPLDLVRGSSAHGTQASTVWYAQPDGQASLQLIQAKRRGGSKTSMIVAYSDEGPDGKITLQNRGAVPQREIALLDTAATIVGYLKENAEASTKDILGAVVDAGHSKATGERALKQLAREGSIIRPGHGRYALPPDESVEATA